MEITETGILQLLNVQGIRYELTKHEAVYTIEDINRLKLAHIDCIATNLFLRDDKKQHYFLLTMKKDKRLDLKSLQARLGTRRLSFASEADLHSMLGLMKGEVSPLGVLNDREHHVMALLDTSFQNSLIGVHPNTNTATLWLRSDDLFQLIEQHGNKVQWLEL